MLLVLVGRFVLRWRHRRRVPRAARLQAGTVHCRAVHAYRLGTRHTLQLFLGTVQAQGPRSPPSTPAGDGRAQPQEQHTSGPAPAEALHSAAERQGKARKGIRDPLWQYAALAAYPATLGLRRPDR